MLHPGLDLHVSHDRIVVMYFFASLTFLLVGLCLCSVTQVHIIPGVAGPGLSFPSIHFTVHPYLDLGLRLVAFGMFLVIATFYQSLIGKKKTRPLRGSILGVLE
jgi:hypothetical protein